VQSAPNGNWSKAVTAANEEIKQGDVNGKHINYFMPNRQIKAFHPRTPGMVAYRDAIIAAINQFQTVSTQGETCHLKVVETWTCQPSNDNLYADVSIASANGTALYQSAQSATTPGQPIDVDKPLKITLSSQDELTMVGEHADDYIQFSTKMASWKSSTISGQASCHLVGHDWNSQGPQGCPSAGIVSLICLP